MAERMRGPADGRISDVQMKANIQQKLIESGEMDRLRHLVENHLERSGWREQLKAHCKEVVQRKGVQNLTVDGLVDEVMPQARDLVPPAVKQEVLQRIRDHLVANS